MSAAETPKNLSDPEREALHGQVHGERTSRDGRFRMWRCGLGDFHAEAIRREPVYTPGSLEACKILELHMPALEDPAPWTGGLLHGPTGGGKTWQAIRELASALRGGSSVKFLNVGLYLEALRIARQERRGGEHGPAFEAVANVRHLVVDDLGAEGHGTDLFGEENRIAIAALFDKRYGSGLETLVTSNLTPDSIVGAYGDRIFSRLSARGKVRHWAFADRRRKAK
ncbi:MAG: ATP-binding protein [Acidobacteriota bacterium]|nr:ATP-binding protein [Acidobacteriota bacterium]MDQ6892238.1 ATP-binding protein [Acidobacteriota bacterium]